LTSGVKYPPTGDSSGTWDRFAEHLKSEMTKVVSGEQQIRVVSPHDVRPENFIPTDAQLRTAILRRHRHVGVVSMPEDQLAHEVTMCRRGALEIAQNYWNAPMIVVEQSPPSLLSIAKALNSIRKAKTPIFEAAAAALAVQSPHPALFILLLATGLVIIRPAMELGSTFESLVRWLKTELLYNHLPRRRDDPLAAGRVGRKTNSPTSNPKRKVKGR
jgi:hypothetical protein